MESDMEFDQDRQHHTLRGETAPFWLQVADESWGPVDQTRHSRSSTVADGPSLPDRVKWEARRWRRSRTAVLSNSWSVYLVVGACLGLGVLAGLGLEWVTGVESRFVYFSGSIIGFLFVSALVLFGIKVNEVLARIGMRIRSLPNREFLRMYWALAAIGVMSAAKKTLRERK
jgi:hypothetical protein